MSPLLTSAIVAFFPALGILGTHAMPLDRSDGCITTYTAGVWPAPSPVVQCVRTTCAAPTDCKTKPVTVGMVITTVTCVCGAGGIPEDCHTEADVLTSNGQYVGFDCLGPCPDEPDVCEPWIYADGSISRPDSALCFCYH